MSSVEQLRFVEKYFDQTNFRGRLGTLEGLYTAVLSGTARSNPNDVLFRRGTRAYEQNPLDWNRDGEITAGEAITPVAARLYGGVRRVQQRLVDLDFVPANQKNGFADSRWGPNTAAAVARFQRANGIPATGLLDDRTGRALFNLANPAPTPNPTPNPAPPNPTPAIPTSTLKEGNRGSQVRQLQNLLVRFGFMTQAQMNTGPGIFGNRTDAALKRFQRSVTLNSGRYLRQKHAPSDARYYFSYRSNDDGEKYESDKRNSKPTGRTGVYDTRSGQHGFRHIRTANRSRRQAFSGAKRHRSDGRGR